MLSVPAFILLLTCLYVLSHNLSNALYQFMYTITKHQKLAVYLLAFLFLPGTAIHELSHFLMATILHVKTGSISVWPEIEPNGHIRAGHVTVAKTDPFRLTIIGVAPMILGLLAIYFIGEYFFPQIYRIITAPVGLPLISLKSFIGLYLIFEITSTFFSSKRDLQAAIYVAPILGIIVFMMYISRLQVTLDKNIYDSILEIITKIDISLSLGVIIQLVLFLVLKGVGYLRN